MNVSAVLIVKDEEKRLQQCLESLSWATEIIVLDSGSSDNTINIANQYTKHVYVTEDWPGFGLQRQAAQRYASCDWVFTIDADEVVTTELQKSIQEIVKNNDQTKVCQVNRKNWAFGRFINHSGWSPDWVVRLYPREKTTYCDSLVHESVVVPNTLTITKLDGRLLHYTYESLYDYNHKVSGYLKSWADQREGKKKSSILKGLGHGFFAFLRMYVFRLGFLDGRHGFVLAFLTAYTTSQKYFDLWLRQHQKDNNG